MTQSTKLHRLPDRGIFGGVIAGIAAYLDIDVSIARLLFLFITLATGLFPGLISYIVMLIILPTPSDQGAIQSSQHTSKLKLDTSSEVSSDATARNIIGGGFIVLGLWYLLAALSFIPVPEWKTVMPILLIIFGVLLLKK